MRMLVRLLFMPFMLMVMRPVIALMGGAVILDRGVMGVRVAVFMFVSMGVLVRMRMGVGFLPVGVWVFMFVGMFVFVAMGVFVVSFHGVLLLK
jgi:hypothetical protein